MKSKQVTLKSRLLAGVLVLSLSVISPVSLVTAEESTPASQESNSGYRFEFFNGKDELNKKVDEDYENVESKGEGNLVLDESLTGVYKTAFDKNSQYVAQKLLDNNFDAYVIGGATRDVIMGKVPNDIDLVTNATLDEQIKIFEADEHTDLHFHTTAQNRTFGIVYVNGVDPANDYEGIDLATYQNTPEELIEQDESIPHYVDPANPDKYCPTSDSPYYDSFERDLSMNSIYYDLKNEDFVDYHGGIHDIRDEVLATIPEAEMLFTFNPQVIIRTLRFKARYEFDLEKNLSRKLYKYGAIYTKTMGTYDMHNQTKRMWQDDYSVRCFDVLEEYGILPAVYPQIADQWYTKSYQSTVRDEIARIDTLYHDTDESEESETEIEKNQAEAITGAILAPAATKAVHKMNNNGATAEAKAIFADFSKTYDTSKLANLEKMLIDAATAEAAPLAKANVTVSKKNAVTKALTFNVKKKNIDKKAVSYTAATDSGTTITFKNTTKTSKIKKYLSFANKKITLKKKAPKGTYTFTLTAKGCDTKKLTTTKTVTIKVK